MKASATFIVSPGATSSISSPVALKSLISHSLFTEPTAITSSYAAGYSTVSLFPAAATIRIPAFSASVTAFSSAAEYSCVPKLMFIMSTSFSIAQ